jgi:aquaporin rerated protein, other eukaryote
VTLALFMTGFLSWYRSILLFFIQFIAGIAAAGMAQVLIPGGINCQTKIAGSTSVAQGFFIEMFMTAQRE